ncbi:hypothetical protein EDF69_000667 [Sphingomonas sp. JUb134]|uniref:Uncharacterized protein n=1 Tax=Sphingomonas molluscorum TaxID=418184 RepID=A0ABU8Q1I0_9SPHN|nr:hypothetical protein [Sphingomonas sp. JUb134]MBM7405101.1 hypothetical protein [Sphingomonas sp. JUb134]
MNLLPRRADIHKFAEERLWVEPDSSGEVQKFDHVDPPLASFHLGDKRLGPSECLSDLVLGQACLTPPVLKEVGNQEVFSCGDATGDAAGLRMNRQR